MNKRDKNYQSMKSIVTTLSALAFLATGIFVAKGSVDPPIQELHASNPTITMPVDLMLNKLKIQPKDTVYVTQTKTDTVYQTKEVWRTKYKTKYVEKKDTSYVPIFFIAVVKENNKTTTISRVTEEPCDSVYTPSVIQ